MDLSGFIDSILSQVRNVKQYLWLIREQLKLLRGGLVEKGKLQSRFREQEEGGVVQTQEPQPQLRVERINVFSKFKLQLTPSSSSR